MRFTSLGSGSEGNALLVEAQAGVSTTRVLLDCGFSVREIERRVERCGVEAGTLDAVFVTHEHADHIGSAFALARKYKLPVFMSWGTGQAVSPPAGADVRWCCAEQPVAVGALEMLPYTVPHDAREPLQFVFSDGNRRLGVLTDAGASTPHLIDMLGGCDGLVLECNHDRAMLAGSQYPPSLKARIGGTYGHLANDAAAGILAAIDRSRLRCIIAAHLSRQNNLPELAKQVLADVAGADAHDILVADQEAGFAWQTI